MRVRFPSPAPAVSCRSQVANLTAVGFAIFIFRVSSVISFFSSQHASVTLDPRRALHFARCAFLLPAFTALFQLTQPLVWYQFPKAQLHVADGSPEDLCAEEGAGFLKRKAAGPFDRLGCFLVDREEAPHTSGKGSRLVWASPKKKRKSWISVSIMRPWCICRMASW